MSVSPVPDSPPEDLPEAEPSRPVSRFVRWLSFLLARRYFIMTYGDPVPTEGGPFLILANHPALIDPLIVYSRFAHLRPRPLMDELAYKRFKFFARQFEPIIVPDLSRGGDPASLEQVVNQAVETLASGRSVLMWPGGRLQRDGRDVLKGKSGAWRIVNAARERPGVEPELILVRTEGLWGSRFSRYLDTSEPMNVFKKMMKLLPAFLLFGPFLPRRPVRLMLRRHRPSPADCASLERLNGIIAAWFAAGKQNVSLVPVVPGITPLPLPLHGPPEESSAVDIAPALDLLASHGAEPATKGHTRLEDLGIDSLAMVQLILHIEKLCGYAPAPAELQTVADVALVLLNKTAPAELPVLAEVEPAAIRLPPLAPIHEVFSRRGDVTDITLGEHFSRSTLMGYAKAVSLLVRDIPGHNLGIALPAGAAAMAAFAGCLGAGRVPVMLDYTMSAGKLARCARLARISHVLTSRRMYGRGVPPGTKAVYLEDVDISRLRSKAVASIFGFDWMGRLDDPAVILFTSGITDIPKGVPLTHRNLMSALRALLSACMGSPLHTRRMSMLCCLPTYHALGFLTNLLLPLVCGVPAVCVADPGNAPALARAAAAYKTTHFVGTPAFLQNILLTAQAPLSFQAVILGAEACPDSVRELFASFCPEAFLIESYGATECAAVATLNYARVPGSIGYVLPGLEHKIHDEELYLRGESVFSGYLEGPDPRVALPGSSHADWYPTGDFFREENGALYFLGRAGRFVQRRGEMISLSALEAVLNERFPLHTDEPVFIQRFAVIADKRGRILALGCCGMELAEINTELDLAGFGPAWKVDELREYTLPGTASGKVDYRALAAVFAPEEET